MCWAAALMETPLPWHATMYSFSRKIQSLHLQQSTALIMLLVSDLFHPAWVTVNPVQKHSDYKHPTFLLIPMLMCVPRNTEWMNNSGFIMEKPFNLIWKPKHGERILKNTKVLLHFLRAEPICACAHISWFMISCMCEICMHMREILHTRAYEIFRPFITQKTQAKKYIF